MRRITAALLTCGLTLAPPVLLHADPQTSTYHVVAVPRQHIQATLKDTWNTPNIEPRTWLVVLADPPPTDGQRNVMLNLIINGQEYTSHSTEFSPLHRPLLQALIRVSDPNAPRQLVTTAQYEGILMARRLVPGLSAAPIVPLNQEQSARYLEASPTINFRDVAFQQWLDSNGLRRKPEEQELVFTRRVFSTIRQNYQYGGGVSQDRRAASLSGRATADSTGLCVLYVATLRANQMPARILVGRRAVSTPVGPPSEGDTASYHAEAEFFSPTIGWIPVEIGDAVQHKEKPAEDYFGKDNGDFLAVHIDADFILDTVVSGHKNFPFRQGVWHGILGPGSPQGVTEETQWSVKSSPASQTGA